MIKALLSLFCILLTGIGFSQSVKQEQLRQEAGKYYEEEQYHLAVQYYRELADLSDQDGEVNFQLAESYRKVFNYKEAEAYYLKARYQSASQFPLALYYYALMLKLNGEFTESISFFNEFILAHSSDPDYKEQVEQAIIDRAGSEMALRELSKPAARIALQAENLNSVFNDYAPALRDTGTLVITSGRIASNRQVIDERYGEAFTDNFYFIKSNGSWHDKTRQVFNITNTRYNDGSGSFNRTGDKYYFTVCGKDGPHCRIYLSESKNDKWSVPVELNNNVNFKNYESKHPAISPGGDTLLFSSNRPGGWGNYDIWMCINSGNDNWGPAINLGSSVNTKLNELAPAVTRYANIFFLASDGHQNYGGLDLYMAKRMSSGTVALYNLDYPFNSNRDDCFITLSENKIYFSSNRELGHGGFDIYSFPISSVISFTSRLSLKNKGARADVKFTARISQPSAVDLLTARNEDRIEYENLTYEKKKMVDRMVNNRMHDAANSKEEYADLTSKEVEQLNRIAEVKYKTWQLQKRFAGTLLTRITPDRSSKDMLLTGTLRDSLSGKTIPLRKILLMNEWGELLKVTSTNEQGNFRFTDIESSTQLYLRLEQGLAVPADQLVITDLQVTAYENNTLSFENIYFDFDHYRLRPEAEQVLNDLATYLKSNPSMQVEMYAYADDQGADDYNLKLTQKRGQSVLSYLVAKGVDETALAVIAKGRQKNDLTQIEIQRQYNRRVEFYLNGTNAITVKRINTYILKKKTDWAGIASAIGVSKEELLLLNGNVNAEVQLFQPIRLPMGAKEIPEGLFFAIR